MTFSGKLSGLFGRKHRVELSASALEADPLRDALIREAEPEVPRFGQMLDNSPVIGNEIISGSWQGFDELARDVARAAVQYDEPRVRGRDKMLPSHALGREILFQMMGSEEMREVRRHSVGDAHDALFSTLTLQDSIVKHANELAEHVDRANEAKHAEDDLNTIDEELAKLRERAKRFRDQTQPIPAEIVHAVKALIKERGRHEDELAAIDQANSGSGMIAVAEKVAKDAAKAAGDVAQVLGQLAGLAPGADGEKDPSQRLEMAQQWANNARLRRILDEAGRLARAMKFARQERTKNVPITPVGITAGRDIARLLPHELAAAHAPELRGLWAKRYGQRSLLEYKMDGKEPANRGPIITVKDGSGSMAAGNRIEHATAVELAALSVAAREKRTFAAVEFGGAGQARSSTFPAGKVEGAEVLAWASHFFRSSGTDISAGMALALEIIESEPAFKQADIILMTDGQCGFGERDLAIRERLIELGVKVHGISIAAPNNRYLRQMCDWQVELSDMDDVADTSRTLAGQLT